MPTIFSSEKEELILKTKALSLASFFKKSLYSFLSWVEIILDFQVILSGATACRLSFSGGARISGLVPELLAFARDPSPAKGGVRMTAWVVKTNSPASRPPNCLLLEQEN